MGNLIDVKGQRFGRLIVIEKAEKTDVGKNAFWLCKCDCGNEKIIGSRNLRSGDSQSCGCLHRDVHTTHKLSKHPLFAVWHAMKARCYNPTNKDYNNYGARNITICNEWLDVCNFIKWAENNGYKYGTGFSIDRINCNGNYEPSNCKFSTNLEQANNKRNNILVNYQGETKTLKQWSKDLNLKYGTIYGRLKKGWSIDKVFYNNGGNA